MRYQVVGKNHRVFGKSFGEYFERNLPEAQERHLIGGGFIVRAPIITAKGNSTLSGFSSHFEAVVLEEEPSAANDDAPTEASEAPTDNPEGMSSSV